MNIDTKRRTYVRKLVIATRAALLQHQAEVMQATTESLRRLDELGAWAEHGADLPDWAKRYAALSNRLSELPFGDQGREAKRIRAEIQRLSGRLGDLFWAATDVVLYATGIFEAEGTPMSALEAVFETDDDAKAHRGPLRAARQALREDGRARAASA